MKNLNKILISGATGFIGSHLTEQLINEGFYVGIIKRKNSDTWRIKDSLDKIKSYDANLQDINEVANAVSHFKPDAILHLATYYTVEHKPSEVPVMIDTNILGAINLLEASKENAVKLFVNTSSCFVYEESENKLDENSKLKPLNLYGLTKIHSEDACSFYAEKYGLKAMTLRLFPPYGPKDNERRLVPYAIKSFLNETPLKMTSGKQKWDFTYVEDVVNAYSKALNLDELFEGHEIFNIGAGNAASVREVVTNLKEITGSMCEPEWDAVPHRKNEIWYNCADINKAKKLLNWEPQINIREGLQKTVEWYKDFWKENGR